MTPSNRSTRRRSREGTALAGIASLLGIFVAAAAFSSLAGALATPSSNDAINASREAFVVALLGGAGVVAAVVTAAAVLALHLGRQWRRPLAVAAG
jgi:hypothetical protein